MKYKIRGAGDVILTDKDFVAKGGEGTIYRKGKVIYKIYHGSSKMIPEAKIQELSVLSRDNILVPQNLILDSKNNLVGFTMIWVENSIPLCKLFTNDFRDREGVTNDNIIELVEVMKETTQFIHQNKCLIVDGNELNYLVDKTFTTPYFLDTDSWKTPSYPPKAIMPSIRDYTTTVLSEMSDWFAFAIVSCQLFVGIHPFKGNHPGYKKKDFQKRIAENVSIFNPHTKVPVATRSFGLIPSNYLNWYLDLFEKGKRTLPPNLSGTTSIVEIKPQIISSQNFIIDIIKKFNDEILHHSNVFGISITKTKSGIVVGNTNYDKLSKDVEVILSEKSMKPIFVKIEDNELKFHVFSSTSQIQSLALTCTNKMILNNNLYTRYEGKIIQVGFMDYSNKIIPAIESSASIMEKSSEVFSNVVYQNILGRSYLTIPIKSMTYVEIYIPELDGYKVIDAKYYNYICILTVHKGSQYNRAIIKLDKNYTSKYDIMFIEDIDYSPINFTVLDNGITAFINEDEKLRIFFNDIKKPDMKILESDDISIDMRLCHNGNQLRFFKENILYSIQMK